MAKKKPKSGKGVEAKVKVPEANPFDVFDDPGPTRALTVPKPVGPPIIQPWDDEVDQEDVHDDPGPTRALSAEPREVDEAEVYDDPGPTRALSAEPREVDEADVHDDPGPTRAMPLEEEPELDAGAVHDDPGPTRAVPPAKVLDEIETEMALGRISEVKEPVVKKKSKAKK